MSDTRNYEVTTEHGKGLLKQIADELPRVTLRNQDSHGSQDYELNNMLDEKVRAVLVSLQMSVH